MGLFSFLDPIFGGGGGGSSSSVTSTVNLNVNGLNDMKTTVELKPVTFTETLEVKPLEIKPLAFTETLEVKPLELRPVTLNETLELKPVTVNETFDLRPVAVDSCQTVRLAPLPETRICQPYRHHVGYVLFGMEWGGVTYEGESRQAIESPRRPQVLDTVGFHSHRRPHRPAQVVGGGGLRVRVVHPDDDGDGE